MMFKKRKEKRYIKDIDANFIRQHKDEVNWGALSASYDFTVDQLREFAGLINWTEYFLYHYHHRQSLKEILQFKNKDEHWFMFFHSKQASLEFLKRWIWEIIAFDKTWRWIIKDQKCLNKKTIKPYVEFIDINDIIDLQKFWKKSQL